MIKKAQAIIDKYNKLSKNISDPEILNNHTKLIMREIYDDSECCLIGEWKSSIGKLQNSENAIYIGGGTGIADGIILGNKIVDIRNSKKIKRSWELTMPTGKSVEYYLSLGGMLNQWGKGRSAKAMQSLLEHAASGDMAACLPGGPGYDAAPGLSAGARRGSQSGGLGPGVPPPHRSDSRPFGVAGNDRHLSIARAGLTVGVANDAERSASPPYVDRPDRTAPGHPQLRGRVHRGGRLGTTGDAPTGIGRSFRDRPPP